MAAEQSGWLRNVITWRAAASIAWAVSLMPPTTALFIVISRLSLLHPIQWISDCLDILTSASAIFSFILLFAVILVIGLLNLEYYTVVPSIACSKIELLGQLLHPRQIIHSLLHCVMGMIVAWCCSVAIGGRYRTLGYPCTQCDGDGSPQLYLNEHLLVLLLAGAFSGLCHSLLGVTHNMNYVAFHTVQQYKFLRFKGSLPLVVKCSAIQSFYFVRNYLLVYYSIGYVPRTWVCKTLNLHLDSSLHPLDTIAGLLDISLLYDLWICGTFLLLQWYFTVLLFRIFVTEVLSFPVQSSFTEDDNHCLAKVLTGKQPMILKFLALQDLALLSQHGPSRRLEVFSLSQPGGHPHNWNAISKECLSLLADLTQRLVAHHDTVATNGRVKTQSTGSDKTSNSSVSSGTEEVITPMNRAWAPASVYLHSMVKSSPALSSPFTPKVDNPLFSPALRRLAGPLEPSSPWYGSVQSPHIMRRVPKLWSTSTVDSPSNGSSSSPPSPAPSPKPAVSKPSLLAQFLQNRQEQVKHFLEKRVLIMYLFNKPPEASSQALFADSQAHIWALEGLSHLVAASFSEDQFGVVQTTLPSILSSMLVLQEAVDRHFKLPHASSKPVRSFYSMGDPTYKTLRFALRATLKTAIYRITTTFGEHLIAIQMSAEHRKRLQQFLEYKE